MAPTPDAVGDLDAGSLDSETSLLIRVGSGDRDAFAELYSRMSPRLFGLVRAILIDTAQSEEVLQDVMLEIWQHAPRFDPERGSAVGWMLRLTRSRTIDRVRTAESESERTWTAGMRLAREEVAPVDAELELGEDVARLRRSLDALTPVQREAIELTHLGGLTQAEASRRLHVPLGTVKTRVRDALISLRRELGAA